MTLIDCGTSVSGRDVYCDPHRLVHLFQGGMYIVTLIDWYILLFSFSVVCLCEIVAIIYVYGEWNNYAYLPTIPDSPELLRKSASNYGITARGKIITDILYYGNLVTLGNNR